MSATARGLKPTLAIPIGLALGLVIALTGAYLLYAPQIDQLAKGIQDLQTKKTELESRLSSANSENSRLQRQNQELETKLANATAVTTSLKKRVDELRLRLQDSQSQIETAEVQISELNATVNSLRAKLNSIQATTSELQKAKNLAKAWSEPFPESRALQTGWWQNLSNAAERFDPSLVPLLDGTMSHWEALVNWSEKQPANVYTGEWADWALGWFELFDKYSTSSYDFSRKALTLMARIMEDVLETTA